MTIARMGSGKLPAESLTASCRVEGAMEKELAHPEEEEVQEESSNALKQQCRDASNNAEANGPICDIVRNSSMIITVAPPSATSGTNPKSSLGSCVAGCSTSAPPSNRLSTCCLNGPKWLPGSLKVAKTDAITGMLATGAAPVGLSALVFSRSSLPPKTSAAIQPWGASGIDVPLHGVPAAGLHLSSQHLLQAQPPLVQQPILRQAPHTPMLAAPCGVGWPVAYSSSWRQTHCVSARAVETGVGRTVTIRAMESPVASPQITQRT